ncbi:hypothetical protein CgunFtcFv8_022422 [Champsocephalus gunnari]|uniref:ZP domain-containing protein n=1 Tax=Champsocephalus gunnari TaxID=52237 RepID=A0AAN8HTC6_CHAGU|nr:hypothetical protein CgunFtcFv8_022422 [Champsocephalus gunnari]
MGLPAGLILALILQILSGSTSGTIASGCDSCHNEANCLKTRERGDSFTSQAYSCVCKDGFVGDGLTCLDAKLCSNSSCCSQGYQWSPDMGCVDTDECSLSESPCTPRQVCQNTPGSFACLEPSTQNVLFHSRCSDCPRGMDCIDGHGSRCADPCDQYTKLNDEWRSTNNTEINRPHCDRNMRWRGWYRMYLGRESAQLPERCLGSHRCGTDAPMWMTKAHPTESNEIVNRKVCAAFEDDCYSYDTDIQVKLCPGNFYVYKLVRPSTCYLAYCAEVKGPAPEVVTTTPELITEPLTHAPRPDLTPETFSSTEAPNQPSQLMCGRETLQVGLDVDSLTSSGLNPLSGNLATLNCSRFTVRDNVVWYEVETRAGVCGNILKTNSTHAIYSNSLFIYPKSNSSFVHPLSVPFTCVFPLDTNSSLDVAVRPFLELKGAITGSGSGAKAFMSLFHDSSFSEKYPAGLVTLPVGSPLYVGVSVEETDPSFAVVLEDCYATHLSNPHNPEQYPLIHSKCPADRRQVSVVESGASLRARFSSLFFLLQHEYRDLYLHCSLSLCDRRTSSCVPPCTHRNYRSVSNSEHLETITVGPILWEKATE